MSDDDINYKRIIESVDRFATPSIGFAGDKTEIGEVVQTSDKIIIRQNNVIIEQLIDIRKLLNVLIAQSTSQDTGTPSWVKELTEKVSKLSLGKDHRTITKVYGGPQLTWKKPDHQDPRL